MSNSKLKQPVFLTVKELCKRWGVSSNKLAIDRFNKRGIGYINLGKMNIRYLLEDVLAYEKKQTVRFD